MSDRPCVALCSGKDCRKRAEYRDLRAAVAAVAEVLPTRCLGLCDSPVAVVAPRAERALVFDKLRSAEQRAALVQVVVTGRAPTKVLAKRLVDGKPRRKALAEVGKHKLLKNRDGS